MKKKHWVNPNHQNPCNVEKDYILTFFDNINFLTHFTYFLADDGLDFGDDDEDMEPSPKQAKINTTVSRICY